MFDLSAYVPYLLNRAGTRIAVAFSRTLARFDVTLPMWRVMAALWHEGPQRLGNLAELTAIETSTLSRIAAGMERKGLISRQRAAADGRVVTVALTGTGKSLTELIIPHALACERTVLEGLSDGEVHQLRCLLERVFENAARLADQPPPPN